MKENYLFAFFKHQVGLSNFVKKFYKKLLPIEYSLKLTP